jgi:alkylation response protein AidB-like acyl-CoA dehydrogenase
VDFTLTDEQELLRDTARTLFTKECPTSLVRAHIEDPAAANALWSHLQSWTALSDGPLSDLCLFLEEAGAVVAPGPFFATTVLYRPLAALAGVEPAATGTVAVAGADGHWVTNDEPARTFVLEADRVDDVLTVRAGAVAHVTGAAWQAVATFDPSRRVFEASDVAVDVTGDGATAVDPAALEAWIERATVAAAAEMVGTARTLLQMSIEYAKQRVQFDKPIGAFQAIQHKLADMALSWERASSAVYYAAMAHDAADADRHRATHVAKAAAGAAAITCARDGIQVHGGIGYTWEHDLHLFLRRAYTAEHFLGTAAWHHERLADLLFAEG